MYLFSQSNRTLQPEINYLCLKKYLNSNFFQTSLLKIHRNIQNVQLDLVFWDRIYIYQYMISLGSATFFTRWRLILRLQQIRYTRISSLLQSHDLKTSDGVASNQFTVDSIFCVDYEFRSYFIYCDFVMYIRRYLFYSWFLIWISQMLLFRNCIFLKKINICNIYLNRLFSISLQLYPYHAIALHRVCGDLFLITDISELWCTLIVFVLSKTCFE